MIVLTKLVISDTLMVNPVFEWLYESLLLGWASELTRFHDEKVTQPNRGFKPPLLVDSK